jgi:hypothetical protein
MILFPCINTLSTVDLYRDFRTGYCAQGAARAGAFGAIRLEADGPIAASIVLIARGDVAPLAGIDAQMTFLAPFPVYFYLALQRLTFFRYVLRCDLFLYPATTFQDQSVEKNDGGSAAIGTLPPLKAFLAHIRENVKTYF